MTRVIPALGLTLAIATVAVLVRARAYTVPQSATPTSQGSSPPHPLILQENDGEHLVRRTGPTAGWPFTIKLDGQNGNTQDFFVFTSTMAPGETIPFHKHDNAEEILFVEEGGATVIVGDQRALAGPRSIVFIPRDTWISAKNSSKHDIHEIAIFSRHGYEQYMRALGVKQGEPMSPLSPDELTRLRALGHSMYWDTSKGPYPPGVAHP
ncbi:MAG: cupin domain-containing protein [Acidobacteriota bacterium]|nr:cupin domain-containing protein [Acidobacteriota bacterium]